MKKKKKKKKKKKNEKEEQGKEEGCREEDRVEGGKVTEEEGKEDMLYSCYSLQCTK